MEKKADNKKAEKEGTGMSVNPLRKEKIFVRFIPQESGFAGNNKNHVLYGRRAEGTTVSLCAPVLRSTGKYKNVLTNEEKDYLEEVLGLDSNALSVYKTENNFWDTFRVNLPKDGIHLDLSDPSDFLKYAVLRANTDIIAQSVEDSIDRPKATYQYVLVRENEESRIESAKMDATMASYREFGKIEHDLDTLRVLIELLDGRPYAQSSPADFLRSRTNVLIQADPKRFLAAITDPMLHIKVILRRATELGKVSKRGDYYYLAADGSPLCDPGENPTLSIAAHYLNQNAHQDIKFLLESEVDKHRVK